MPRFRQMKSLQKFASVHANSQNYFSLVRPPRQSAGSAWFDESRLGAATELVPAWVDELLA